MKIIEALKKIKDYLRKIDDLKGKIKDCAAKMSFETSAYDNQREKVDGWLQSCHDLIMEVERLKESIAKTNISTQVAIEINGNEVTKSIHSWISRKRELCDLERSIWSSLGDKGLRDQAIRGQTTQEVVEFKVVRFYDPAIRDKKIDEFKSEKSLIDAKLEIVNAVTDLI